MPSYITWNGANIKYLNDIVERAISNPEWFWSGDPDAVEARYYVNRGKGGDLMMKEIWDNTPEEIKSSIDQNFLPSFAQSERFNNNIRSTTNNVADTITDLSLKGAGAAMGLGLLPYGILPAALGVTGGYLGSKVGARVVGDIAQNLSSGTPVFMDDNGNIIREEDVDKLQKAGVNINVVDPSLDRRALPYESGGASVTARTGKTARQAGEIAGAFAGGAAGGYAGYQAYGLPGQIANTTKYGRLLKGGGNQGSAWGNYKSGILDRANYNLYGNNPITEQGVAGFADMPGRAGNGVSRIVSQIPASPESRSGYNFKRSTNRELTGDRSGQFARRNSFEGVGSNARVLKGKGASAYKTDGDLNVNLMEPGRPGPAFLSFAGDEITTPNNVIKLPALYMDPIVDEAVPEPVINMNLNPVDIRAKIPGLRRIPIDPLPVPGDIIDNGGEEIILEDPNHNTVRGLRHTNQTVRKGYRKNGSVNDTSVVRSGNQERREEKRDIKKEIRGLRRQDADLFDAGIAKNDQARRDIALKIARRKGYFD